MEKMNRRRLLVGLLAAPAIIRTPGLLMPLKAVMLPTERPVMPPATVDLVDAVLQSNGFLKAMNQHTMNLLIRGSSTLRMDHRTGEFEVRTDLTPANDPRDFCLGQTLATDSNFSVTVFKHGGLKLV